MAGKTRRQRAKSSNQKKNNARRQIQSAIAVQQTEPVKEEAKANIAAPKKTAPTQGIKPSIVRYPYIASELRTIGILSVAILAILIVLSLVI